MNDNSPKTIARIKKKRPAILGALGEDKRTKRSFIKQTGGLTLASAFGLGYITSSQQLLAATSGSSVRKYIHSIDKSFSGDNPKDGDSFSSSQIDGVSAPAGQLELEIEIQEGKCYAMFDVKFKATGKPKGGVATTYSGVAEWPGYTPGGWFNANLPMNQRPVWNAPLDGKTAASGDAFKTYDVEKTIQFYYSTRNGDLKTDPVITTPITVSKEDNSRYVVTHDGTLTGITYGFIRVRRLWTKLELKIEKQATGAKATAKYSYGHKFDGFHVNSPNHSDPGRVYEQFQNDLTLHGNTPPQASQRKDVEVVGTVTVFSCNPDVTPCVKN